ncbi:SdrD B-like domain-containing protein [Roseiconus lacunae]|uniref:SdrD B-like domain-containing protein n=1 Tax=Roseiconus lacunae TaxID=2605694 RepID=UPI0030888D3C|nr:SdrD B-like domain-containing protein [Stieleria sp. HD01]
MSDWAWIDENGDGFQSSGETGLGGVTVRLFVPNGSGWEEIEETTTSGGGSYSFDNLDAGEYAVSFSLPSGYQYTSRHAGGESHYHEDSDAAWVTLVLAEGEDRDDIDAGYNELPDFTLPRLQSLVFDDLGVLNDPSAETNISTSEPAARYGKSHHWYDFDLSGTIEPPENDLKIPAAFIRSSTPSVDAAFKIASPDGPLAPTIEIKGVGTGGMNFPVQTASLTNGVYVYSGSASSAFPNTVKHYDDYQISWQTREPGGDWEPAGTSSTDLYLTLAAPKAPLYHTSLHLGSHYADGKTTQDQVIDTVWNHTKQLTLQKQDETTHIGAVEIKDVGDPLTYWANYANSSAANTPTLLHNLNGSCGSFADLFVSAMQIQGIDQQNEIVQVTTSIFVNGWNPAGPQVQGNDVIVFRPYDGSDPNLNFMELLYSPTLDRYVLNQHSQLSRQTRVFGFKHLDNTFPLAGGSDEQTAGEGALSGPEGPTLPVGIGIYTSFSFS